MSHPSSRRRSLTAVVALAFVVAASSRPASVAAAGGGAASINTGDLKAWLTQIASDEFEGRATFSEGLGLAAAYIASELKAMGVKPGGDNGSYFQRVSVLGVKSTSRNTVSVTVNGETRTFKEREGFTLPRNVGGKRTVTADQVEFVGYGANLPMVKHDDYSGKSVAGKIVVYLGSGGPKIEDAKVAQDARRLLGGRARYATEVMKAVASIGPPSGFGPPAAPSPSPSASPSASPAAPAAPGGPGGGFGRAPLPTPDFTTVERLDKAIPPVVSAQDEFFEFLFSASDVKYADLKAKASKQEPLPAVSLKGVSIAINLDTDYEIVRTQFTRNVVGIVEGGDPKLKDTYVAFGAHYDHNGYAEGELVDTPVTEANPEGKRRLGAMGVKPGAASDRIWNGADDDGSGTVTLLSLAKAFATGPKTKRSTVFIWHTGEERGLWGSRYFADHASLPIEKIAANFNMDMVGRNRQNRVPGSNPPVWEEPKGESDRVYLVGSDRISTELHNLSEDANASSKAPMKLDYEMNDPADLEQVYYRSDHYSYAAKGVPVIFYTTGLHGDYHFNTDSVEKIEFEKMARISHLMYATGFRVANLDRPLVRDNKGPRVGKGSAGKLQ